MNVLTEAQVASYRYNGFLFPIPALTPAEVAALALFLAEDFGVSAATKRRRSQAPQLSASVLPRRLR